jgi:hypothetical protein
MNADTVPPRATAGASDHDVNRALPVRQELPETRSTSMAYRGTPVLGESAR